MDSGNIAFYLMSVFLLTFGLMAVTSRKIFRSAIWLLFSLIGIAGLYFLMDLQFLAAVQIIVYIGGIVVLIIFSIFLTQSSGDDLPKALMSKKIIAAILSLVGFGMIGSLLWNTVFETSTLPLDAELKTIGHKLLSTASDGYALPFELVSVLLLAAMVGCIVIALKREGGAHE
jgi:NADH-quinone oxidoreductase subunit J